MREETVEDFFDSDYDEELDDLLWRYDGELHFFVSYLFANLRAMNLNQEYQIEELPSVTSGKTHVKLAKYLLKLIARIKDDDKHPISYGFIDPKMDELYRVKTKKHVPYIVFPCENSFVLSLSRGIDGAFEEAKVTAFLNKKEL